MDRKNIGLFFSYNPKWIGGTYYWLNWVNALNCLPDDEKPIITIIGGSKSDFIFIQKETSYPYLDYVKNRSGYTLCQKALNAFTLRTIHKRVFVSKLKGNFDAILPAGIGGEYLSLISDDKKINWFPDFQYDHLPEFYTPLTMVETQQRAVAVAYLSNKLMLSSEDAKNDFLRLFPPSKAKIFVQPFTVTHPDFSDLNKKDVMTKFSIDRPYYYSPNQYWAHKNHLVVINAIEQLVKRGKNDVLVLFSGKEWDNRNPDYVPKLKKMVKDKGLDSNIKFLGFLDRKEQLLIMKESVAIIQPSLFEGWSTVIEDARSLGKYVIASNISVNKEQISQNCSFFDPHNPSSLAEILLQDDFVVFPEDYNIRKLEQARRFMKMVND